MKEAFTQQKIFAGLYDGNVLKEEALGCLHLYKNEGLFPNSGFDLFNQVTSFQFQAGLPVLKSQWWHFIYSIPRR